jgi:beta-lactamase superfamily II metal-dependent hydrolase
MARMKLHVLDVGQGSSAILDFGNHRYGIVDCGGKRGPESRIVGFLHRARRLNPAMRILFLLVTHLDLDHVRAIDGLIEDPDIERRIEKLYCNDLAYRTLLTAMRKAVKPEGGVAFNPNNASALKALAYLGDLVHRKSQTDRDFHYQCLAPESDPERYPVKLQVHSLVDEPVIELWAPSQFLQNFTIGAIDRPQKELFRAVFSGQEVEDWNTGSVVMTITVAGKRLLIAGDATRRTWTEIFERAKERWTGADAVVAWHHGGKLGSSDGVDYDSLVWRRVLARDGKVVLISCGSGNRYGHPHLETLGAIEACGGKVFCTQRFQSVDPEPPSPRDEVEKVLYRKSKGRARAEDDGGQCCGDIVVEFGPPEGITVRCSTSDSGERKSGDPCCKLHTISAA